MKSLISYEYLGCTILAEVVDTDDGNYKESIVTDLAFLQCIDNKENIKLVKGWNLSEVNNNDVDIKYLSQTKEEYMDTYPEVFI